MSKVFIVQQSMRKDRASGELVSHDYSTASRFGEIVFVIPSRNVVEKDWNGDVNKLLAHMLKDFNSETDFFVPSGDAILCLQAALAVAKVLKPGSSLRTLKWSNRDSCYQKASITIP